VKPELSRLRPEKDRALGEKSGPRGQKYEGGMTTPNPVSKGIGRSVAMGGTKKNGGVVSGGPGIYTRTEKPRVGKRREGGIKPERTARNITKPKKRLARSISRLEKRLSRGCKRLLLQEKVEREEKAKGVKKEGGKNILIKTAQDAGERKIRTKGKKPHQVGTWQWQTGKKTPSRRGGQDFLRKALRQTREYREQGGWWEQDGLEKGGGVVKTTLATDWRMIWEGSPGDLKEKRKGHRQVTVDRRRRRSGQSAGDKSHQLGLLQVQGSEWEEEAPVRERSISPK